MSTMTTMRVGLTYHTLKTHPFHYTWLKSWTCQFYEAREVPLQEKVQMSSFPFVSTKSNYGHIVKMDSALRIWQIIQKYQ